MQADDIIVCENLVKIYKTVDLEVLALQGLEINIARGELMAIIGNSGSGKSTFLNMIGGLDRPSAGRLIVDGKDLFKLNEAQLVEYKRTTVGFVWQNNARNLLPYLPAWQNVQMPMMFGGVVERKRQKERALELLEIVGLAHKKDSKLSQLSGGEQQRVSIARALAKNPKLLLCDEPTGALDDVTGRTVLELLHSTCRQSGMTVVVITHNQAITPIADRVIKVRNGKVKSAEKNPNPLPVERIEW